MGNRKYFVAGHTANGFVNYIESNLIGVKHVFVLDHVSHHYKTFTINELINTLSPQHDIDVLLSPFGKDYLEGIIIRDLSCAVITNQLTRADIPFTLIPLEEDTSTDVLTIHTQTKQLYDLAYTHFSKGLAIHDKLEKIYIKEMDFTKADHIADQFITKLLQHEETKESNTPHEYHRMLGTNMAEGSVNIVPYLIKDIANRVYIKGRAGTGKSVFMKKVAQACTEKGFDIELYHCSFDPDSIDMVIVRELGFCIFDSTDPHAFSPEKETDIVIDLYKQAVAPKVDERFADEISQTSTQYKAELKKGTQCIKQATNNQETIEQQYQQLKSKDVSDVVQYILETITTKK